MHEPNLEETTKNVGWDVAPKGDESAMWTLVGAVGQVVLTGWTLSVALTMAALGIKFITDPMNAPSWVNGIAASIFFILAIGLFYFSIRLFIRAVRSAWATYRKAMFLFSIRRYPDATRSRRMAEGDPLLEPYLRFLVRRGFVDLSEPSGEPL